MAVEVDIKQLLEAGVHFGHKTSRWHPKMAPYIHSKRQDSHIIDLTKTVEQLDKALPFITKVAATKPVLFVGTKKQAKEIVKTAAEKANQINRETDSLKKETRVFRQRLQIMVESQLEMIKNEEWDTLLNSPSEVEISIPSIDTISRNRAVKAEETVDVVEQSDVIEGESNPSL